MIINLYDCEDALLESAQAIQQFIEEPVLFKLTSANYTKTMKYYVVKDKEFCVRYTLVKNIVCNFVGTI